MNDVELSSADVVRHTGCTTRQLDYWTRTGTITPSTRGADGYGSSRRWSRTDADAIAAITRVSSSLIALGHHGISLDLARLIWDEFHENPDALELRVGILTINLRQVT